MDINVEVFEIEAGRFGYRVDAVLQEWHPDKAGFEPMTEQEATELGEAVKTRMIKQAEIDEAAAQMAALLVGK